MAMFAPMLLALLLWLALPAPGVWLDEAATVSATSRSWSETMTLLHHQDLSLGGYYAAVWACTHATHLDPLAAARLVSGLAYVAGTGLVTLLGRRIGGPRVACVAGCAFTLLPSTSASAVNARPEALATALVAGSFLCAVRGRWLLNLVLGVAACAVYALSVLYLPLALLVTLVARHGTHTHTPIHVRRMSGQCARFSPS